MTEPTVEQPSETVLPQPGKDQFTLNHIYMKDCSFESPMSPAVFMNDMPPPDAGINIQTQINGVVDQPNLREVVLTVTVEARTGEQIVFVCEVHMAATVSLPEVDEAQAGAVLGARVPEVLFPYVRQAISDLVTRGGFLPVMLQPIDFDAVYAQHAANQGHPLNG